MSTRTSPRSAAALPLTPAPTTQTCAGDSKSKESRAWRSVECTQYYTETQRNRRSGRLPEATLRVKYEDFPALGGITPTHSRTDDADICRRQQEQGVTCVANSSRNRAAVAALVARASTTRVESAHVSTSRRIHTVASTIRRCGVKQRACSPPVSDFAEALPSCRLNSSCDGCRPLRHRI